MILREEDLAWTIASDVLLVTTPEEARTRLITRVYDVSDLLTPARDLITRAEGRWGTSLEQALDVKSR